MGVVKDQKVTLTPVTPGHDFGNEIEIVAGLKPEDQIIINPPDSIVTGQQVQIVQSNIARGCLPEVKLCSKRHVDREAPVDITGLAGSASDDRRGTADLRMHGWPKL